MSGVRGSLPSPGRTVAMKTFDLQGIELSVALSTAFTFISDAAQLPKWTSAFASVTNGRAIMRTPRGEVAVRLTVDASADRGTVDWRMTFPDGSVGTACSRLVRLDDKRCVYTFVLTPPPV